MKCFSLFSGIGGFDLAARNLGHEIIGACEIDKYARTIYARHFPGVKIYEDATRIKPEELPDFDILVAGFPCQAFSVAGRRLGFEESRGTLFFEIARIAKQKRPRLLLLENVKGLLSHDNGKTFAVILSTLDELGYDAEWQVLNSKYFVPQNRERIFIVGHLRGQCSRKIFPVGEVQQISSRKKDKKMPISRCLTTTHYKNHGDSTYISEPKIKSLGSMPIPFMRRKVEPIQKNVCLFLKQNKTMTLSELSKLTGIVKTQLEHYFRHDSSGSLPDKKDWMKLKDVMKFDDIFDKIMTEYVEDYMTHEMATRVHDSTGISPTLTGGEKLITAKPVSIENTGANGRRIKDDDDPQFCLSQNCGVGVLNNQRIRRLTPIECSRLQGFPDTWCKYGIEFLTPETYYKDYGKIQEADSIEILFVLQKTVNERTRERWRSSKLVTLLKEKILQSRMYEKELCRKVQRKSTSTSREMESKTVGYCERMWEMWLDEELGHTSQGQKHIEQLFIELRNHLQKMSCKNSSQRFGKIIKISDTQRYKCLGNAVTVPVVEYILSHLTLQTSSKEERETNGP